MNDHALILPVIVDEVVDFCLADISAAPGQGIEIDQSEACRSQCQGRDGKAEGKVVGQAEESQRHGPEGLIEQSSQNDAQYQRTAPHDQILQKEQPGRLLVFQTNQKISAQFPAPAKEHKSGGIGHQPAKDTEHYYIGQSNQHRQHFHGLGQGINLPGKYQSVKGIEQGGSQHHGDKVYHIISGLASGVA